LHFKKEVRAVSTLLFILIELASLIIGGFISYMWVMSSFYNMPQNPSFLSVENVVFSQYNFNYFNVTVLNPSNSNSQLNITGFQLIVESQNETFSVGTAEPALPFQLKIGAKQDFKCSRNWSDLAGETVKVEPLVDGTASTRSLPYVTPMVKLLVSGFSTAEDVGHFNLTVQNSAGSAINLTLTDITVFNVNVNSTSPSLPTVLSVGQQQVLRCAYNWTDQEGLNLKITVHTDVGYEQVYETSTIQSAVLGIDNVYFDNADASYFKITVISPPPPTSTAVATLSGVNVTLADNTTLVLQTIPTLIGSLITVAPNGTQSLRCLWNWSAHRNEQIVVQAFTKQGFTVVSKTVKTPAAVVWSVGNVQFDLNYLGNFSVNVTNAPVSLGEINITEVDFNQNTTSVIPVVVAPANSSVVVCGFNWTGFVGASVAVTVHAVYGQNEMTISQTLALPYLKVANATFSYFPTGTPGNPYVNVTLFNSLYSPFNATVTQISVTANNATSLIDGTLAFPRIGSNGYLLSIGSEMTFVCPWDWNPYFGQNVTFTVQTKEGPTFSATFQVG
jgi:hypothetical protein